jgi:hypothetical protein
MTIKSQKIINWRRIRARFTNCDKFHAPGWSLQEALQWEDQPEQ